MAWVFGVDTPCAIVLEDAIGLHGVLFFEVVCLQGLPT